MSQTGGSPSPATMTHAAANRVLRCRTVFAVHALDEVTGRRATTGAAPSASRSANATTTTSTAPVIVRQAAGLVAATASARPISVGEPNASLRRAGNWGERSERADCFAAPAAGLLIRPSLGDRKSTRLNSSHV